MTEHAWLAEAAAAPEASAKVNLPQACRVRRARAFYEIEAERSVWPVEHLERQIYRPPRPLPRGDVDAWLRANTIGALAS